MSARERASSRLERALAASGSVMRDESASPHQPLLAASHKLGTAKAENAAVAVALAAADNEDDGGLETLVLLGSAAVQQQCMERVQPAEELISRAAGISERLETLQNDSLKTRNLLREVEAMVSRAIDEADDDGDAPPPRASSAMGGGRLPPSRALGGWTLSARGAGSASGRHAAPAPVHAWEASSSSLSAPTSARGGGVLLSTARGGATVDPNDTRGLDSAVRGGGGGGGGGIFGVSAEDDVEVIRARRLLRCEEMEATGAVLHERVDGLSASLGAASDANAKLAARLDDALDFTFSASELRDEMARVEAEERRADRELATSARDRIRARSQAAADKLSGRGGGGASASDGRRGNRPAAAPAVARGGAARGGAARGAAAASPELEAVSEEEGELSISMRPQPAALPLAAAPSAPQMPMPRGRQPRQKQHQHQLAARVAAVAGSGESDGSGGGGSGGGGSGGGGVSGGSVSDGVGVGASGERERGGARLERLLAAHDVSDGLLGLPWGGGASPGVPSSPGASSSSLEGGRGGAPAHAYAHAARSPFASPHTSPLDGTRMVKKGGADEEAMLAAGLGSSTEAGAFPWSAARQELRDRAAVERPSALAAGGSGSGRGREMGGRGAPSSGRQRWWPRGIEPDAPHAELTYSS